MVEIYSPAEDSWLIQDCLKEWLKGRDENIRILDMGSGSGILGHSCIEMGFENVLCVDISKDVVSELKKKSLNAIQSDLFSNVRSKFDLIVFNSPYLPLDKREPLGSQRNTTGGVKGCEVIVRFLRGVGDFLSDKGRVLLLFSSLSCPEVILGECKKLGFDFIRKGFKKVDFELLEVYEVWKNKRC